MDAANKCPDWFRVAPAAYSVPFDPTARVPHFEKGFGPVVGFSKEDPPLVDRVKLVFATLIRAAGTLAAHRPDAARVRAAAGGVSGARPGAGHTAEPGRIKEESPERSRGSTFTEELGLDLPFRRRVP